MAVLRDEPSGLGIRTRRIGVGPGRPPPTAPAPQPIAAQKAVLCPAPKSRLAAEQAAGGRLLAGSVSPARSEMIASLEA